MAVIGNAEERYELAWINALKKNLDFGTTPIRAWSDQETILADNPLKQQKYPVVLVHCSGVEDPTTGESDGYDRAFVELQCHSWKDDDPDKSVVSALIGTVRDVINSASVQADMEEIGGIDIRFNGIDGASFVDDSGDIRVRSISMITVGTLVNLPPP